MDLLDTQTQIAMAEKPAFMNVTTKTAARNLVRNSALAGAFGLLVMLVILIFCKYIIDARRNNNEQI